VRDEISIETLRSFFENKFSPSPDRLESLPDAAEAFVAAKCNEAETVVPALLRPSQVGGLIKSLKKGRCAGADGILAEHLIYAASPTLNTLLSDLLNLCIRFHTVPSAFTQGLLIPVLKKPHLDATMAKNYRPITVSSTLAKVLELYILRRCHAHQYCDMQYGFIEGLGTDIAATLAHDVISHCIHQKSAVYVCSLDAEGAFDCIPHPVLFRHCYGIIPDPLWLLMVKWYSRLSVCIRWNAEKSSPIRVLQGTRQGGLTSPFLFNAFYQDIIDKLNSMEGGIMINGLNYNVFCYADDVLLASLTVTGLQRLIDTAQQMLTQRGLRFNPSKSVCATFGDSPIVNPSWMIDGAPLKQSSEIVYLGVTLSRDGHAHADARIKACRRAFFGLAGAGLRPCALHPSTMTHLWSAAVRPILLYGAHCTHIRPSSLTEMQRTQTGLLKRALGLNKRCRNTALMAALQLRSVEALVDEARARTLQAALASESRASAFFGSMLAACRRARPIDPRGSVAHAARAWAVNGRSIKNFTGLAPRRPKPALDGIHDSIKQLLAAHTRDSMNTMNLLLMPF
jgi:hypothetical protein